ncbi:unnamed protein product, partial [Meganyctiphanes norvegica]
MEENPPKVNKWDGNAIKNALDDAVKDQPQDAYGCVMEHRFVYPGRIRDAWLAGLALLFPKLNLLPTADRREVMCVCVICYFIMMGVLTWYTTYMERGIFCTALNKDAAGIDPDDIWHASSCLKRFDHIYHLTLSQKDGKSSQMKEARTQITVENFFDESGKLVYNSVEREVLRLHSDVDHKKE